MMVFAQASPQFPNRPLFASFSAKCLRLEKVMALPPGNRRRNRKRQPPERNAPERRYLGHRDIRHTVRYTELSPTRFSYILGRLFDVGRPHPLEYFAEQIELLVGVGERRFGT